MNPLKIIILRGVSGAGKSTFARQLHGTVVSADDYFMRQGRYEFNPRELPAAHAKCMRDFIDLCQGVEEARRNMVIVDNTNTTVMEVAPYVAVGQAYGHDVEIITIEADVERAAARNVHGVPTNAVRQMAQRLVDSANQFPPWWKHRVVQNEG